MPRGGRPGLATLIRGGVQGSVSADHQDSWGAMSDVDYPIDPFDFSTPDDAYKVVAIESWREGDTSAYPRLVIVLRRRSEIGRRIAQGAAAVAQPQW
jgi:hypothetical protein